MPVNRKAIEAGLEFEREFAASIGAKLQPGSGNQWFAKLDVDARTVLWSLKSSTSRGYRITADDVQEAIRAARGPAGAGVVPGMAIRFDGAPDLVVVTAADLFDIARGEVKVVSSQPSKRTIHTALADRSLLDRQPVGSAP